MKCPLFSGNLFTAVSSDTDFGNWFEIHELNYVLNTNKSTDLHGNCSLGKEYSSCSSCRCSCSSSCCSLKVCFTGNVKISHSIWKHLQTPGEGIVLETLTKPFIISSIAVTKMESEPKCHHNFAEVTEEYEQIFEHALTFDRTRKSEVLNHVFSTTCL